MAAEFASRPSSEQDGIRARGFAILESGAIGGTVGSVALTIHARESATQPPITSQKDDIKESITLTWPSLGLDLRVRQKRFRDRFRANPLLPSNLADALYAEARSPTRAAAFLASQVFPTSGAGTVVADDRSMQFTRICYGGQLLALLDEEIALAARIDRALHALPLPPIFAPHTGAWNAAARAFRGRLERGTASLHDFTVDGYSASIVSLWDAHDCFIGTELRLGPELRPLTQPIGDPQILRDPFETWARELRHRDCEDPSGPYR